MTEDEVVREFYDPPELTQDESIREFYDPPYNPPSKTRPRLERVMKIKPDLKVMPIQLPNSTRMSNAQVNTSIGNSALGRRFSTKKTIAKQKTGAERS